MSEIPDFYDALALLRDGSVSPVEGRQLEVRVSDFTVKPICELTPIDLEVHADYLATKRARLARREVERLNVMFYLDGGAV